MKSLLILQQFQSEHHINGMTGGWTGTPFAGLVFGQFDVPVEEA